MSIDGIRAIAEKYQSKVTGKLGIGFIDLQTGEKYTLNGTELFPTASVCKVFTLAALYKMVAEGKANDTDRYEMTEDVQVGGSGVLVRLLPGLNPTLYDYAMLMMILSDNTAADFLFKFVGGAEGIRENVLEPLALTSTKCDLSIKQMFPLALTTTLSFRPTAVTADVILITPVFCAPMTRTISPRSRIS